MGHDQHGHGEPWHQTSVAGAQREHGGSISIGAVFFWGGLLVIATVGSIGAVWVYFDHYISKVKSDRFEYNMYSLDMSDADAFQIMRDRESRVYKTGALEGTLRAYGWVDAQKGVVQVPIAQAKDAVIKKYSK